MKIAKLFKSGGSQAVRLPKSFGFLGMSKVYIHKVGNKVILEPMIDNDWEPLLKVLEKCPKEFDFKRLPPDYSTREDLFS